MSTRHGRKPYSDPHMIRKYYTNGSWVKLLMSFPMGKLTVTRELLALVSCLSRNAYKCLSEHLRHPTGLHYRLCSPLPGICRGQHPMCVHIDSSICTLIPLLLRHVTLSNIQFWPTTHPPRAWWLPYPAHLGCEHSTKPQGCQGPTNLIYGGFMG